MTRPAPAYIVSKKPSRSGESRQPDEAGRKLFFMNSLPYLLTLLITVIGGLINYMVQSEINSPLVEYRFKIKESSKNDSILHRTIECHFENLSHKEVFTNVQTDLMFDVHIATRIFNPYIIAVSPSALDNVSCDAGYNKIVHYEILKFQPGFKYIFAFETTGPVNGPTFPKVFISANEGIRIKESNVLTWAVRNKIEINFGLIITLVLLIALYIWIINKK